jgi:hypothetical protein
MTGLISIVAGTLHLPAAAVTFRPAPIDIAAAGALILVTATLIVTGLWRSAGAGRRRRGQERAALRALDEELDALLADVRQAMNQRDKIDLTSAESCGPLNTAPVSRLLAERMPAENIAAERSFDRFRGALPRRAPLLDLLAEFRMADRAFRVEAMRLDRRLADVIGGHNAANRIDPAHDLLERSYFLGCVLGISGIAMDTRMGVSQEVVEGIQARYTEISADPEITSLLQPYLAARKLLAGATENLAPALG